MSTTELAAGRAEGATRRAAEPFASTWRRQHLTVDQRIARGRAARKQVPRSSHGPWQPASDRSEWENPAPQIKKLLSSYRRTLGRHHHPLEEYRYVHSAYKMVGVGSVGTRCYIMLLLGRDYDDPLFLQVKEAQASVLERFLPKSTYSHHGERVVAGQRLMQAATDIFLGWQRIKGLDGVSRDYYVRQFQDWKGSADVDSLLVPGATLYSRICGATLARAHARWGDRIAIAS